VGGTSWRVDFSIWRRCSRKATALAFVRSVQETFSGLSLHEDIHTTGVEAVEHARVQLAGAGP
jgi:hypothetical protein